ncbi:MAG TPA: zinc ribbon domain-containing protein [Archangium sp.]|uniref:YIP1 family protein n=1 Tax=Archangium sp. TaxID=1872627 RepID=UPI002E34A22D|nr:zinc ribbon domain-containing protein [Archangium sp.]HEX5754617.1 zinc ribbon domain-containing protein [Archangium sp.]
MNIPCPYCQHPITPGATTCPGCGTSLLREATPQSAEPTCGYHPRRLSLAICDRCGTFACAECLRLNSRQEVVCQRCHALEQDTPLPWDLREELGTFTAWWKTVVAVMFHPDTFPTFRPEGSAGESLLFAVLCAVPTSIVGGLSYMGFLSFVPYLLSSGNPSRDSVPSWLGPAMFVAIMILGPLLSAAYTVIQAGLDHLVLKMGGVTRGFQVTLRANAFSQAPWLLGAVPCIGPYVAPVWGLVARVFAYRGLHRTSWGVALAGCLVTPLLSCCLCGGIYLSLIRTLGGFN